MRFLKSSTNCILFQNLLTTSYFPQFVSILLTCPLKLILNFLSVSASHTHLSVTERHFATSALTVNVYRLSQNASHCERFLSSCLSRLSLSNIAPWVVINNSDNRTPLIYNSTTNISTTNAWKP